MHRPNARPLSRPFERRLARALGVPLGLALGVGVCALASGPAAAAAIDTVEVEGMAAVTNNDIGRARDRAIDDAKRKAVEQVVGTRVTAESVTQNFQLVQDRVYARASGFVKRYQIVSELKDGDTYVVKLKCEVDGAAIADDLSQIMVEKPRVIVLVAEQNVGGAGFSYWWANEGYTSEMDILQTSLISNWLPKGFKFVDPSAMRGKLKVAKAMRRADLDEKSARLVAKDADADIAVIGKVVVTDAGTVMEGVKMRSFHAVGNLRVVNVDTGEIIAVSDDSAVAAHIDGNVGGRQAIKALGEKLSASLERAILAKWTAEAAGASTIEVVVTGALEPAAIDALRGFLADQRGVERAEVRRKTKTWVALDVRVRGGARALGQALEGGKVGTWAVDVDELSAQKLTLALRKP
jgi:hypothetical protein